MTLAEIRDNNMLISCLGINFVNPVFRLFSAQFPYNVESFTIYSIDDRKKEKSFKKLLDRNSNPFLLIVRGQDAELEEVLFVPSKEHRNFLQPVKVNRVNK